MGKRGVFCELWETEVWLLLAKKSGFNANELAALCRLSTRQLNRYSHKCFARSAQDWLNEQRILAAAELLRRGVPVKVVSVELGFKHVPHFSRQFKSYYGVWPSDYSFRSQPSWQERMFFE